jgi:hypothetical protein
MPRLKNRKRHNRWKAPNKNKKWARRRKFSKKHRHSTKTGLKHGPHDYVRSGYHGPLDYCRLSKKSAKLTIWSRCPQSCLICRGEEPGCKGGWERRQIKLRRYEESVEHAKERLRRENDKYMRYMCFFRTLASLFYLQLFTFFSRNPSPRQVFFSLYDQSRTVERYPCYPSTVRLAFQNRLAEAHVAECLKWKTEKRWLVLSPRQRKRLMCLGGSARNLAMVLAPATQRCEHFRFHILSRLFEKKSFLRLIQAGGLNKYDVCTLCTVSYFGE